MIPADTGAVISTWRYLGDLFAPLIAPVTAGIATYIAYQQWQITRRRLQVDLYDRRLSVFTAVRQFLSAITRERKVPDYALPNYVRDTAQAAFLFDRRVRAYLEELYQKAVQMWALQRDVEPMPVGPERTKKLEEHAELLRWFNEQMAVAVKKFERDLKLR